MPNLFLTYSLLSTLLLFGTSGSVLEASEQPNVLWISCEDISPHLGCYGDPHAITPNLDKLAERGVRYTNAFTTTPVCATNRSSIITGMYPTTIGTHYMRCQAQLPAHVRCFTEYLREAGYYCTNNSKEDYNFARPDTAWDESSNKAHWRGRRAGQPFFAVFNFTLSHESKVWPRREAHRKLSKDITPAEFQDPSRLTLPPYYPDTPEVRRDWANYYENITQIDHQAGAILEQLDEDGLADDTIVFFWSDHGVGLPRAKRWAYDSGTRVPLIVQIPEKFRNGVQAGSHTVSDELVSFIDLAPTVLNLVGLEIPVHMQGRAFLGNDLTPSRQYVVNVRDRMDSRYDMIRAVRDKRYRYIRNYMPWKPYSQYINYAEVNQTMRALRRAAADGTLPQAAQLFMADSKPVEELYDGQADPHEIRNLARSTDPEHQRVLERMRNVLAEWEIETHDLGLIPEPIVNEREAMLGDRISILADRQASQSLQLVRDMIGPRISPKVRLDHCEAGLTESDPVVRFWAVNAMTHLMDQDDVDALENRDELSRQFSTLLDDPSTIVRITAADAYCRAGQSEKGMPVLLEGLTDDSPWIRLYSVNYLSEIAPRDPRAISALESARDNDPENYVQLTAEHALHRIDGREIPSHWGSH